MQLRYHASRRATIVRPAYGPGLRRLHVTTNGDAQRHLPVAGVLRETELPTMQFPCRARIELH